MLEIARSERAVGSTFGNFFKILALLLSIQVTRVHTFSLFAWKSSATSGKARSKHRTHVPPWTFALQFCWSFSLVLWIAAGLSEERLVSKMKTRGCEKVMDWWTWCIKKVMMEYFGAGATRSDVRNEKRIFIHLFTIEFSHFKKHYRKIKIGFFLIFKSHTAGI